jgi:hypothetical protein
MNHPAEIPGKKSEKHPDVHPPISHSEPQYYTCEGSEFLDDAIRMVDQPLTKGSLPSPYDEARIIAGTD